MNDSLPYRTSKETIQPVHPQKQMKRGFLNKFLTKTHHCISECDPQIASWSNEGTSFTIKDVDAFQKEVLSKYFNHSRFDSFIRQLNFYSFHKSRSDPDLQLNSKAIRYTHEFFRKGQPELLSRIQRSTARKGASMGSNQASDQLVATLQQQVDGLKRQVQDVEKRANENIDTAIHLIEAQHLVRIRNLETLVSLMIPQAHKRLVPSLTPHSSPQWETAASLADLANHFRSNPVAKDRDGRIGI